MREQGEKVNVRSTTQPRPGEGLSEKPEPDRCSGSGQGTRGRARRIRRRSGRCNRGSCRRRWCRSRRAREGRVQRRADGLRRQEDPGDQGRARADRTRPQRGQGPGRGAPKAVKEGVNKAEAEDIKKKLEAAGGTVELK